MARFFGPDQSWRGTTSLTDLQTDFASEFGMEPASDIGGSHGVTHTRIVNNLRSMFELISVETTGS
jgi:hypothetical protein